LSVPIQGKLTGLIFVGGMKSEDSYLTAEVPTSTQPLIETNLTVIN